MIGNDIQREAFMNILQTMRGNAELGTFQLKLVLMGKLLAALERFEEFRAGSSSDRVQHSTS